MKTFFKYLLLMVYTIALQTALTVATIALAGPVVWIFVPAVLGIFVGIFVVAARRFSFSPGEGLIGALVLPFLFWMGCITLALFWPERSSALVFSVILIFLVGSALVDLVGILLYGLSRGIRMVQQKQSLLPHLILLGKCLGFTLVFAGALYAILLCSDLAYLLGGLRGNYTLILNLSVIPYTGLVFLFCRPLSNAFKLAGKWLLLASSLFPLLGLTVYGFTLSAQEFEQGVCSRLLVVLLLHALLTAGILLVLCLTKKPLFTRLVCQTPDGKVSLGVRVLCAVLALVVMGAVGYHLLHPTHWRYNDPFVLGNTPAAIKDRYGSFDYSTAESETDQTFTAGYVVDTYETDTYYLILFRDGVAQEVQCSLAPGG